MIFRSHNHNSCTFFNGCLNVVDNVSEFIQWDPHGEEFLNVWNKSFPF